VPLEVKEAVWNRITKGDLRPGEQLPAEERLAGELGVSRGSVRAALALLEREGLVERRHGIGTFVSRHLPRLRSPIHRITTIPALIRQHGHMPQMVWLRKTDGPIPEEARRALAVAPDAPLLRLERVYSADEKPAVLCVDFLPTELAGRKVDLKGFGDELLTYLEQELDVRIVRIFAEITAAKANAHVARSLALQPGAAVIVLRQTGMDRDGRPVTFGFGYHDPEVLSFEVVRIWESS